MAKGKLDAVAARLEPLAYLGLRVVSGSMLSFHGMQKLFGFLATTPGPVAGSQLWFGGIIELAGGVLMALGILTRPAAFLASGTMCVAYMQFHWKFVFGGWKWLPAINKGELAVLYCFVFLLIAIRGSGYPELRRALASGSR